MAFLPGANVSISSFSAVLDISISNLSFHLQKHDGLLRGVRFARIGTFGFLAKLGLVSPKITNQGVKLTLLKHVFTES